MTVEEFKADYDWRCAFSEAINKSYGSEPDGPIADVVEVIAADEGENDERDWICIVRLTDGRYAFVAAGCDYTGWDCQASGHVEYYDSLNAACSRMALTPQERERFADQLRARTDVVLDWDD